MIPTTLDAFLNAFAEAGTATQRDVAGTVRAIASAALQMRAVMSNAGPGAVDAILPRGADDPRGVLGHYAAAIFLDAMRRAPVALYFGTEAAGQVALSDASGIAVAIHPLDGFSNIDINAALGTIFSVLPTTPDDPAASFRQPGRKQMAAGFVVYGPQLGFVLTLGSGTHAFVFSATLGVFVRAWKSCDIPPDAEEYAVNASNYRHWNAAVRVYIDDCISGADGPRQRDFDMRWGASLVAHIYRILMRGGVYLDPGDTRKGCARGRLELVRQANPIAILVEQAGGRATDTVEPILDIVPETIGQLTPLVCGSRNEVERIARYHTDPSNIAERAPLFGNRGLFRV